MIWDSRAVAEALGLGHDIPQMTFSSIETDTRTLRPGSLFVALRGENFDGHEFLASARAAGATGAVVQHGTTPVEGLSLFEVDDTRVALGRLARYRRDSGGFVVVAITGSSGKTSAREMIAAALRPSKRVHSTGGNRNNLVGVPLTIIEAPDECDVLVLEIGASERGEVARLREVARPDIAVITNVSAAHLSGFGDMDQLLTEKASLGRDVPLALVGTEPPGLADAVDAGRVLTVGLEPEADVHPAETRPGPDGCWSFEYGGRTVELTLIGRHQVINALFGLGVAEQLGIDPAAAAGALAEVRLPPGRGQLMHFGDLTVIHDAYNANPVSAVAALETAISMRGERPVVFVLGTMLELGSESVELHRQVARRATELEPDLVVAIGEFADAFREEALLPERSLILAPDVEKAGPALRARLRGDEVVLLKGSRGVQLEKILPYIIEE